MVPKETDQRKTLVDKLMKAFRKRADRWLRVNPGRSGYLNAEKQLQRLEEQERKDRESK